MNKQSKALGEQCSERQRLVESFSAKQAILKCHEVRPEQYYDMRNLPEPILIAVHEHGYGEYLARVPKCEISVPKGRNVTEYILNFILRYNNVGYLQQQLKSVTLKGKKKR